MSDTLRHLAVYLGSALILMSPGVPRANAREMVAFSGYAPGTIVVKTGQRRLYYVVDDRRALRFPVGVGRAGMAWSGSARIEGKYVRPAWSPPDVIRAENPNLPEVIPGGAANNPMGAGRSHHGCIRMYNSDIQELYRLVSVGTPVLVEQ
jgi:lipoprotein-anchoring transpeptidase ErfK/SrfK